MEPLDRYLVHNIGEEGDCNNCGCPLLVGDRAYLNSQGRMFCSRRCAEQYRLADLALCQPKSKQ